MSIEAMFAPTLPRCNSPRSVYIDAGVNFCNSLTLFKRVPEVRSRTAAQWTIFGFEMARRIVPFAEQCTHALSNGKALPESPLPPAGSSKDLEKYAIGYNCSMRQLGLREASMHDRKIYRRTVLVPCMTRALQGKLARMKADRRLSNNRRLLRARLALAAQCQLPIRDRYVLLPAAVGTRNGVVRMTDSLSSLLTGGPSLAVRPSGWWRSSLPPVAQIDFSAWMRDSFSEADFVVLKMDIEGTEHQLVPRMIADGTVGLVDVWLWECHHMPRHWNSSCTSLKERLRQNGVKALYDEPYEELHQ